MGVKPDYVKQIKDQFEAMVQKKPATQIILLSREEFEPFIDELLLPNDHPILKPFAKYGEFVFYKVSDVLENTKLCILFFRAKPSEVAVWLADKYKDLNINESILVRSTW